MKSLFIIPLVLMSLVSLPSWSDQIEGVGLICDFDTDKNKSKKLLELYVGQGHHQTFQTLWFSKNNRFEWFTLQEINLDDGGTDYAFNQIPNSYEISSGKLSKSLGLWGTYQLVLKQREGVVEIIRKRLTPVDKAEESVAISVDRYSLDLTHIYGRDPNKEAFSFNCEVVRSKTELKSRQDKIVETLLRQRQQELKKRKI